MTLIMPHESPVYAGEPSDATRLADRLQGKWVDDGPHGSYPDRAAQRDAAVIRALEARLTAFCASDLCQQARRCLSSKECLVDLWIGSMPGPVNEQEADHGE